MVYLRAERSRQEADWKQIQESKDDPDQPLVMESFKFRMAMTDVGIKSQESWVEEIKKEISRKEAVIRRAEAKIRFLSRKE